MKTAFYIFAWLLVVAVCSEFSPVASAAEPDAVLDGSNATSRTVEMLKSGNTSPGSEGETDDFDPFASFLRVMIALAVVIGIFLCGVWVYRNRLTQAGSAGLGGQLKVLESKFIGNRQGLFVVAYGEKRILLGTSQQGIAKVSDLPDLSNDEVATVFNSNTGAGRINGNQQEADSRLSFASILAKASNNQIKGNKDVDSAIKQ